MVKLGGRPYLCEVVCHPLAPLGEAAGVAGGWIRSPLRAIELVADVASPRRHGGPCCCRGPRQPMSCWLRGLRFTVRPRRCALLCGWATFCRTPATSSGTLRPCAATQSAAQEGLDVRCCGPPAPKPVAARSRCRDCRRATVASATDVLHALDALCLALAPHPAAVAMDGARPRHLFHRWRSEPERMRSRPGVDRPGFAHARGPRRPRLRAACLARLSAPPCRGCAGWCGGSASVGRRLRRRAARESAA